MECSGWTLFEHWVGPVTTRRIPVRCLWCSCDTEDIGRVQRRTGRMWRYGRKECTPQRRLHPDKLYKGALLSAVESPLPVLELQKSSEIINHLSNEQTRNYSLKILRVVPTNQIFSSIIFIEIAKNLLRLGSLDWLELSDEPVLSTGDFGSSGSFNSSGCGGGTSKLKRKRKQLKIFC